MSRFALLLCAHIHPYALFPPLGVLFSGVAVPSPPWGPWGRSDAALFQAHVAPLFEVCMELCDGAVGFRPSLDVTDENSFLKLLEDLLADMYGCAACMPRLLEGKLSYKVSSRG